MIYCASLLRFFTIAHHRRQLCARWQLGGEVTRQNQAKITRQKQISPIAFLDASLWPCDNVMSNMAKYFLSRLLSPFLAVIDLNIFDLVYNPDKFVHQ